MVLTPVSGPILVTPVTESIDFVALQQRLRWAELRILQLEEQLRLARIAKYGPSSEKLNDAQLLLLEQEPGVSRCLKNESKAARKHPGRQSLPALLQRVERTIAVKPEDCKCKACGAETKVIGYDESQQLDVEPPRFRRAFSTRVW